jgi:CHAT domain-containing protein
MSNPLRILMLAASPKDTSKLALEQEHVLLRNRMRQNLEAANCELLFEYAVRPLDLQLALKNNKSHVIHFAGHGNREGIWLEDDEGNSLPLSKEVLAILLDAGRPELRLVVLNACSSTQQLDKLREVVDFIIGTRAPVLDEVALCFTAHFYENVAAGNGVRDAFLKAQGKLADGGARQLAENYELLIREGADENKSLIPPASKYVINAKVEDEVTANEILMANQEFDGVECLSLDSMQANETKEINVSARIMKAETVTFVNTRIRGRKKD